MTKFGHLAPRYSPRGRTSEFLLPISGVVVDGVEQQPSLTVQYAGESNKPFHSAVLKHSAKSGLARRMRAAGDTKANEMIRARDLELFPGMVVVGWNHIPDATGAAVSFSKEDCADFLRQLPPWLFDDLRMHCYEPMNFLADDEPSEGDVEDHAGN